MKILETRKKEIISLCIHRFKQDVLVTRTDLHLKKLFLYKSFFIAFNHHMFDIFKNTDDLQIKFEVEIIWLN